MPMPTKTIDGLRECSVCQVIKPISEFNKNGKYLKSYCKECGKIERQDFRKWILTYKETPCVDCGKQYPAVLMDFDHVPERGEKIAKVNTLTNRKAVLKEIAKCDVVCPMCHRIRTATRAGLLTEEELNVLSKL